MNIFIFTNIDRIIFLYVYIYSIYEFYLIPFTYLYKLRNLVIKPINQSAFLKASLFMSFVLKNYNTSVFFNLP